MAAHKREKKRTRVIEELIASEKSYVASLQILVRVYIAPLRAVADAAADRGRIFSHEDLDLIFLNVELLLKVNGDFLAELEALEGPARGTLGVVPLARRGGPRRGAKNEGLLYAVRQQL